MKKLEEKLIDFREPNIWARYSIEKQKLRGSRASIEITVESIVFVLFILMWVLFLSQ